MAESTYNSGLLQYVIDPFEIAGVRPASSSDRKAALEEVADYLKESVLSMVGGGTSPVSGHRNFKQLNREYAEKEKGGDRTPNLELFGDMLDALDTRVFLKDEQVALYISGDEAEKADGHCHIVGDGLLPVRRFIPDAKEKFKADILAGIKSIVRSYEPDSKEPGVKVSDFINTEASEDDDG